jgi:hypothetical protein
MPEPHRNALDMNAHLQQVGLLCSQWAYLEWMLEIAIWWFSDLLDKSDGERLTETGGKAISILAREAHNIAHRKLTSAVELDALKDVARRIENIIDERNLAIHGVRKLLPDEPIVARVTRGKYKGTFQDLPMIRLQSLNDEVARIIAVIEPILQKHGVIEGITEETRRYL